MDDDLSLPAVEAVRAFIARRMTYLDNFHVGLPCGFRELMTKFDADTHLERATEMVESYDLHKDGEFPLAVHLLARAAIHVMLVLHRTAGSGQGSASVCDLERLCDDAGSPMSLDSARKREIWDQCKAILTQADFMLASGAAAAELGAPPYPARPVELRKRFNTVWSLSGVPGAAP